MTTDRSIPSHKLSPSHDGAHPADHLLEQARSAKAARDALAYKTACEAWLLQDRGIHVGDTVKLHYSGELREILLENFELHWPKGQPVEIPTLVFEGPTVQKKPLRVERASNWCGRKMRVSRKVGLSTFMRSQLAELAAA